MESEWLAAGSQVEVWKYKSTKLSGCSISILAAEACSFTFCVGDLAPRVAGTDRQPNKVLLHSRSD